MSIFRRIVDWLPRDMALPDDEFRSRHLAMTVLLALHLPVLAWYGLSRGAAEVPLATELAIPAALLLFASLPSLPRTVRSTATTAGLLVSSIILLQLSGGAAEASLHFLIVLAFTFLYRTWGLFGLALVSMAASYPLLSLFRTYLGDGLVVGEPEMAMSALMTAGSLASIGLVLAWKSAADSQAATVAALDEARDQEESAARRDAYGKMYVNLARRSQSLVDRQLTVIDKLEQDVDDPDVLADVFELDHLTTRIRRHGESLLVVADVDLPSRVNSAVALSDVVRGAQSEIEQYRRVDARIEPSIAVRGPVTRDLVHLFAELLDNATSYSPPSTTVKVHARSGDAGSIVLTVEDHGLGLTPERLEQANADLRDTDALDENSIRHLGLRVVARLANKHGVTVRLTSTTGGGVTAWVQLPAGLIASGDTSDLAPARLPGTPDVPEITDITDQTLGTTSPPPPPAAPAAPTTPAAAAAPTSPAAPASLAPPVLDAPAPAPAPAAPSAPVADDEAAPDATATPTAGFSASGRRGRRGRRSRNPVSKSHDRSPAPMLPPSSTRPAPAPTTQPDTPPVVEPLPTRAVRIPKAAPKPEAPEAPQVAAPPPTPVAPPQPAASQGLPKRERGASATAQEEALDLFGELEAEAQVSRSSLSDYQRGQDEARQEDRP